MAQNKVQYQRGLSMPEFFDGYCSPERCAASAKHPAFSAVNTALGNIKTSLAGTYHAFGFRKYTHRYLAQVQYLFNRRFDLRSIL